MTYLESPLTLHSMFLRAPGSPAGFTLDAPASEILQAQVDLQHPRPLQHQGKFSPRQNQIVLRGENMKKSMFILFLSAVAVSASVAISNSQYTIIQLTDNSYDEYACHINDNGLVVWRGYDGSDDEIFLFDGTKITQITDNSYVDRGPQINNKGDVVWTGYDGSDYEVFLFNGTSTSQITDNTYDEYCTRINDNGYVVWFAGADWDDYEVFLFDGINITQITDNSYEDQYPQISNSGYVGWSGGDMTALTMRYFFLTVRM